MLGRVGEDAHAELAGIGDDELDLPLTVRPGLTLRGGHDLAGTLLPVPAADLGLERRRNRLLVVVLRGDVDLRRASLAVNVGVGLRRQIEAAIGRDRVAAAGDFAIACVGDARLNAIGQVLPVFADGRWNGDLQLAVGVERARVLLLLLAAAVAVVLTFVALAFIARRRPSRRLPTPSGPADSTARCAPPTSPSR